MKLKLALTTILLASISFAAASKVIVIRPGAYKAKHEIGLMYVTNAAQCTEEGGEWSGSGEDGLCIVKDAADTIDIRVEKTPVKKVTVNITAVGTNIHTCEFQGQAVALKDGRLLAKAETETDDGQPTTCDVIISKDKNGIFSKVVKGKEEACAGFCGANMSLDVYGAK